MTRRLMKTAFFFLLVLALAACGAEPEPTATPVPSTPTPSPTPPPPPQELSICIGEEPSTLYPIGPLSSAAREVLAAVYDGPIDIHDYGYQPVILEKLPSLEDEDALIETVVVNTGQEVVDAEGRPVTLQAGMRLRPTGCRNDECAVTYSGGEEFEMDQMVVTFRLLPDLLWSDGTPLTAGDSVYSFTLASESGVTGSRYIVERTVSYEVVDERTVQWVGKPGFLDPTFFTNFWMPLPEHAWGEFNSHDLPGTDVSSVFPMGWGPYIIKEWIAGESIQLERNPNYFRAGEGLPYFETLVYRFAPNPDQAISMLLAGSCDLLAPSVPLDHQAELLLSLENGELLQAEFTKSMVMEHLLFGIRPASYDDGFSLEDGDRPDLLADPLTRQAIALCVDRQDIVETVLGGLTSVPDTLLPAGHPLYNSAVTHYAYDPTLANQLLEEAGWVDDDGDPSTPRLARQIEGVKDGTEMQLELWTSNSAQRQQVSRMLVDSLKGCGIQVNLHAESLDGLYTPGPDGALRGRKFDLAQTAMGSLGMEPLCEWFLSSQIPQAENGWSGVNFSGYPNPAYDAACRTILDSLPGDEAGLAAYDEMQAIYVEDLPSVPLYWRIQSAAARPDFCHFSLDPAAVSNLYGLETYGYGVFCSP